MSRNNLWFLTLFSLILILGVYYITLPSDIFSKVETKKEENITNEEASVPIVPESKNILL